MSLGRVSSEQRSPSQTNEIVRTAPGLSCIKETEYWLLFFLKVTTTSAILSFEAAALQPVLKTWRDKEASAVTRQVDLDANPTKLLTHQLLTSLDGQLR